MDKEEILYYEQNIHIDLLLLDWDNPRLRSRFRQAYSRFSPEERELILIYNLVAFFSVDEMVKSMYGNRVVTIANLTFDKVVTQEEIGLNYLIVKEGNRRVCSLKIIRDVSILQRAKLFVETNNLNNDVMETNYNKSENEIIKILSTSNPSNELVVEVPTVIYKNNEEASKVLKECLRNTHVKSKARWEAVDKQLFDYDEVYTQISEGAENLEDAFLKTIQKESETISINEKERLKELKKDFSMSAFYHYMENRICIGKLGEDSKDVLLDNLVRSFRPVCDVLVRGLRRDDGIVYEYEVNKSTLVSNFKVNLENFYITDVDEYVDELVKMILISENRPISNTRFSNSKSYKELFRDLRDKYIKPIEIDENGKEITISGNESKPKGQPGIHLKEYTNKGGKYIKPTFNEIINLRNYINNVYNSNGEEGDIEKITITIDGKEEDIIGSQQTPCVKEILFIYQESETINHTYNFTLVFKAETAQGNTNSTLLPCPVAKNKQLEFVELTNDFLKEIDELKVEIYPHVLSALLRGLFEVPIPYLIAVRLIHFDSSTRFSKTDAINKISLLIENSFDTRNKCEKIAYFYGIDADYVRNALRSSQNDYVGVYEFVQSATHGKTHGYDRTKVKEIGQKVSVWLYLCNYLYLDKLQAISPES